MFRLGSEVRVCVWGPCLSVALDSRPGPCPRLPVGPSTRRPGSLSQMELDGPSIQGLCQVIWWACAQGDHLSPCTLPPAWPGPPGHHRCPWAVVPRSWLGRPAEPLVPPEVPSLPTLYQGASRPCFSHVAVTEDSDGHAGAPEWADGGSLLCAEAQVAPQNPRQLLETLAGDGTSGCS